MDRIYVVGAGGIGCAVGYALLAGGGRVGFVESDPAKVEWGARYGVQVDQRPPFPAEFISFADWQPAAGSTILLCTKCYDNAAVLARLPADAKLVPVQNGFDPALDARGHAWEGIASFVSECLAGRTHTRITRAGKLHVGRRRAGADVACGLVNALWGNDLFRLEVVADILPYKHTKLMYNAAISPLAAAAGLDNGQLLSVLVARRLFFQMLHENYAILHGAGIPLAKIGPFHPDTVQWILRHRFAARSLAWAFYPTLRGTYCSMSGDLPKGVTEIDNYNGHLIAVAGNQPCPLNRRAYELVKKMERERIAPSLQVLAELLEPPLNAIA
jgi:2-dehydropantoate 2-reductase